MLEVSTPGGCCCCRLWGADEVLSRHTFLTFLAKPGARAEVFILLVWTQQQIMCGIRNGPQPSRLRVKAPACRKLLFGVDELGWTEELFGLGTVIWGCMKPANTQGTPNTTEHRYTSVLATYVTPTHALPASEC